MLILISWHFMTPVAPINSYGRLQGQEQLRVRSTRQVPRSRIGAWYVLNCAVPPKVRTGHRRWTDLGPFSLQRDRERESTVPLSVISAATECSCPLSSRACVPSPVASTPINTTFWNVYDRVQASKSHLLHSRWSIDVGIESQTPFSPDSLRKTPLPCSPISPERSRVFPIAGRHPWTNHS